MTLQSSIYVGFRFGDAIQNQFHVKHEGSKGYRKSNWSFAAMHA